MIKRIFLFLFPFLFNVGHISIQNRGHSSSSLILHKKKAKGNAERDQWRAFGPFPNSSTAK
jgi:hypothetical protein